MFVEGPARMDCGPPTAMCVGPARKDCGPPAAMWFGPARRDRGPPAAMWSTRAPAAVPAVFCFLSECCGEEEGALWRSGRQDAPDRAWPRTGPFRWTEYGSPDADARPADARLRAAEAAAAPCRGRLPRPVLWTPPPTRLLIPKDAEPHPASCNRMQLCRVRTASTVSAIFFNSRYSWLAAHRRANTELAGSPRDCAEPGADDAVAAALPFVPLRLAQSGLPAAGRFLPGLWLGGLLELIAGRASPSGACTPSPRAMRSTHGRHVNSSKGSAAAGWPIKSAAAAAAASCCTCKQARRSAAAAQGFSHAAWRQPEQE